MPCSPQTKQYVEQRLGRTLKPSELKLLDEQADRLSQIGTQRGKTAPEIQDDAIEYANQMVRAEKDKKRNAIINAKVRARAVNFIDTHYGDRPDAGIEILLMGGQSARFGSRASVARDIETRMDAVSTAFYTDIEQIPNGVEAFSSGKFDNHIARAMDELHGNQNFQGIPPIAVQVAKVIHKHNEMLRVEANRAGAWIGKEKGYLTRRGHDQLRIRGDKAGWMDHMRKHIDWKRTLRMTDSANIDEALETIYAELAAGVHIKFKPATKSPTGFQGMSNIARGMSQERVLHFNTPEAEVEYMQKFGFRTIAGSMSNHMNSMSRDIAIMKRLGTNPEDTIAFLVERAKKQNKTDQKMLSQIANIEKRTKDVYWPTMSGASGVIAPGQGMFGPENLAKLDHFIRSVNRMSLLTFIVPSQIPDIALRASQLARDNRSFFGGVIQAIQELGRGVPKNQRQAVFRHLGVAIDGHLANLSSRYDVGDHLPGRMSAIEQKMFKYSGAQPWTDRMRGASAMSDSHFLADNANKSWTTLEPDFRRSLEQQGIDAKMWTEAKNMIQRSADGNNYLIPTMGSSDRVRDAFQGFMHDRATTAVLNPDMKTRAALTGGFQQGTLARFGINQFAALKAFPVSVIQRVLGQETMGRTTELATGTGIQGAVSSMGIAAKQIVRNPGARMGMVKLMVAGTILGYASLYIKDLIKGRTPREFTGDTTQDAKLFMAAMMQGGALGIYGDFLQGDKLKNRYGGNVFTTFMGPGFQDASDAANIVGNVMTGDDPTKDALKFMTNNAPFVGSGPLRTAVDYLFMHEMMEYASPGYVDRIQKRIQKDMGQEYRLNTFSEDFLQ